MFDNLCRCGALTPPLTYPAIIIRGDEPLSVGGPQHAGDCYPVYLTVRLQVPLLRIPERYAACGTSDGTRAVASAARSGGREQGSMAGMGMRTYHPSSQLPAGAVAGAMQAWHTPGTRGS